MLDPQYYKLGMLLVALDGSGEKDIPFPHIYPLSHDLPGADSLIRAIEADPQRHWKTYDLRTHYREALDVEKQFKQRFDMTFIEYARARRLGFAFKYIRTGKSLPAEMTDAFSEILEASTHIDCILFASWLDTPLGPMIAVASESALYLLEFVDRRALETEIRDLRSKLHAAIKPGRNSIIDLVRTELNEYFRAQRDSFHVPVHLLGSTFQKGVWQQLVQIPIGRTSTYAEIARKIGSPSASRGGRYCKW